MVWGAGRSRLCGKKGAIVQLYTQAPDGSVTVCLDEMGPESAKSFPGKQLVLGPADDGHTSRAKQEIDMGGEV